MAEQERCFDADVAPRWERGFIVSLAATSASLIDLSRERPALVDAMSLFGGRRGQLESDSYGDLYSLPTSLSSRIETPPKLRVVRAYLE